MVVWKVVNSSGGSTPPALPGRPGARTSVAPPLGLAHFGAAVIRPDCCHPPRIVHEPDQPDQCLRVLVSLPSLPEAVARASRANAAAIAVQRAQRSGPCYLSRPPGESRLRSGTSPTTRYGSMSSALHAPRRFRSSTVRALALTRRVSSPLLNAPRRLLTNITSRYCNRQRRVANRSACGANTSWSTTIHVAYSSCHPAAIPSASAYEIGVRSS